MADDAELALFRLNALQLRGDWSAHEDGDGRLFYFDHAARRSQWEAPPAFAGREGALMMMLMLQHAVARSGAWSAHDAGHGTLYYFNKRTRASVWERPTEWGSPEAEAQARNEEEDSGGEEVDVLARARAAIAAEQAEEAKQATEKKKKLKKRSSRQAEEEEEEEVEEKLPDAVPEEQDEPMTEEERAAAERKQAAEFKRIDAFRQMLRDKKVMPFTKWSVAMPRIISDPRFVAIPTMEERRAIFEHFVQHRRDDLKAEKKGKLKDAKKAFTALLRDQFASQLRDGTWDAKTDLSVFLATLEDALDAEQYKSIQENAMALLPKSTQEKLYEKAMADSKEQAEKLMAEESKLYEFLHKQLTTEAAALRDARWENEQLQQLVVSFYDRATTPLLSKELQRRVFRRVQDAVAPARPHPDAKYGAGYQAPPAAAAMEAKQGRQAPSRADPFSSSSTRHDPHERSRSRSREREHRSRSQSRGRARERDPREESRSKSRREHRSTRRSPSSSSRSRSRSRSWSRQRRTPRHRSRRSRSSSRSSSRSRSRRR